MESLMEAIYLKRGKKKKVDLSESRGLKILKKNMLVYVKYILKNME